MTLNRLQDAHSAYLRQHAGNPVDWWEWNPEAFEEARQRDVPIFLSVGYAACHWCHVMAHESFENEEIAAYINQHFVAIKVDREERPDVDSIYMSATQAVSGHGGWPMSVFLRPDGRAFMAGTYYPPVDRQGHPGFLRLLQAMHDGWTNQRPLIDRQTEEISRAVEQELSVLDRLQPSATSSLENGVDVLESNLLAACDEFGGFSRAPKFPRPSYISALLRHLEHAPTKAVVTLTLDAMSRRGLYDHLRGGFARYSVDAKWHVPHFEKMLSDQALLAMVYLRADRAMGGGTPWRAVALDTLAFVRNDLRLPRGFTSSLDADSNGEEGAHATWTPEEVVMALDGAGLHELIEGTLYRYELHGDATFEGRYIPQLAPGVPFVTPPEFLAVRAALCAIRALRPQPGRDDKVILEWNAMTAVALFETFEPDLVNDGLRLLDDLASTHHASSKWYRTDGKTSYATAADLAWFAIALTSAYEATAADGYLERSAAVADYLLDNHWQGELPTKDAPHAGEGILSSSKQQSDLPWRARDVFDGATPSGYATATMAFARLAKLTGEDRFLLAAERLIALARPLIIEHPTAVPDLLDAALFHEQGVEVVIPGPPGPLLEEARRTFMAHGVIVHGTGTSPLLRGRAVGSAYVCRNSSCQTPVDSPSDLRRQLASMPQED
ncbi:unannotated protein [freshwater metagenome]|uniref:Unannotated protein n=1 Tax=freshwater metagenome TaxID=449393 RepID=A0A6J7CX73_9ZZZZ|nr:thioredoxin domain-containing protein [Actinomycetota bacterium]